ncbi:MBL fold metallo-hydrolase [Marinilactibacillus piezotolerans]|uniref:MBL fold metallo-hydrolase n=1 Tax=Marinilactibacillus piezotolerans TaxID=258723 RepID=UPI0009AF73D4|nr:MBL fold metallo-hydrolase [Marinilactibacillus piezotolerans]
MIQVKQVVTGMIEENCYILYSENQALIIDPGDETSKIKDQIEELGVRPIAILLTHTHYDHIGSLEDIRVDYDVPVYVSPKEQDWLGDPSANLSVNKPYEVNAKPADHLFSSLETLKIGPFTFDVVPTPGHSPGGVSFIFHEDQFVISGDALFKESVGRTDLPGSEPKRLLDGIRKHLFTLPENYAVYPGHGRDTSIGHEKAANPYFN